MASASSDRQRDVLFAFSLITVLGAGGVFLGFGPWAGKISDSSDFNDVCDAGMSDSDCSARKNEIMQYIFNAAFQASSVASVIVGFTQDHFGPRVCGVGGTLVSLGGNLLMAFASWKGNGWILFVIAYVAIAGGGIGPYLSSFHIASLYKSGSFIITVICGTFNLAGCVYILFSALEVTRQQFYIGMAVVSGFGCVGCFLLYPSKQYAPGDECVLPIMRWIRSNKEYERLNVQSPVSYIKDDAFSADSEALSTPVKPGPRFTEVVKSLPFMLVCLWYAAIALWVSFLGGALPNRFTLLGDGDGTKFWPENIFNNWLYPTLGNGSWFFAPLMGLAMQRWGFPGPILVTNIVCCACVGTFLVNNLSTQLATLALYAWGKACIFGVSFAYLAAVYPGHMYGSLIAVMTGVAAIIGLSTFGIVSFEKNVLNNDPTWIVVGLCVLIVPTTILVWVARSEARKKNQELASLA
jgi:MFS family permease